MNTPSANDRAQISQDAAAQFWKHITPIVQIAFAIHIVLFFIFMALHVTLLLATNVVSIGVYLVCLHAIRRQRFRLAGTLMSLEIIGHALLATWVLGWDSNFHFYVFCVVPIIAFSYQAAPIRRLCLGLAILLVTVGGFTLRQQMGNHSGVSSQWLGIFGVVNVLTATSLLLHAAALSVRFSSSMQLSLFQTAHRDSLTDLYTRRRVLQRVRQLGLRLQGASGAIVLLDIDHFKAINDQHGHDLGDLILQRVAQAIIHSVRGSDIASRWGGEEFLVLMPDTSLQVAQQVAQRLLERIRANAGQLDEIALEVTATVAVGVFGPDETFREAFKRVDQLLYQGKEAGRNRIMISDVVPAPKAQAR